MSSPEAEGERSAVPKSRRTRTEEREMSEEHTREGREETGGKGVEVTDQSETEGKEEANLLGPTRRKAQFLNNEMEATTPGSLPNISNWATRRTRSLQATISIASRRDTAQRDNASKRREEK